jgi:hypothetical protein
MKLRIGEVSYDDGIDEYEIVAEDNIRARDLLVLHLQNDVRKWKSIRVRDTPQEMVGEARVIRKL